MSRPVTSKSSSRASSADENVLGASLKVRGRVNGDGDLRVEGQVEGDVKVSGALTIDAGGAVTGNAAARAVSIEGALTGDVEAEGEVTIRAGARVVGNMNGAQIALEEGAAFSGRIEADFELPDGLEGGSRATASRAAPAARGRR
jgi:cytoskeletal protein CcmA (bactofilin family)